MMRESLGKLGLILYDGEKLSSVDTYVSVDAAVNPELAHRFPGRYALQDKVGGYSNHSDTAQGEMRFRFNVKRSINGKDSTYGYGEPSGPSALNFQYPEGEKVSGAWASVLPGGFLAAVNLFNWGPTPPFGFIDGSGGMNNIGISFNAMSGSKFLGRIALLGS